MANWGKILSRGDVEDRRGISPVAAGGLGLGGLALYLLFNILTGQQIDPTDVLSQLENAQVINQNVDPSEFEGEDEYEVFASTVLGSNNDMWGQIFGKNNKTYTSPRLVLFRTTTVSECGTATSQVGPHYCPLDETIYLDETFFDELRTRFGAKGGDVAEAYVISHEVAHHTQNKLGIMDEAFQLQSSGVDSNRVSVNLEIQADCFAGLWVHSIRNRDVFEEGEIIEAMDAAAAVGDDRIQQKVTGYINPENWTHGSSEQRKSWFTKGYETGDIAQCQTFN
jgi:hypothetical protein